VNMYPGGEAIYCSGCSLTARGKTIFTKGGVFFDAEVPPCEACGGAGCDDCAMYGEQSFQTPAEALAHLQEHRDAGHTVPEHAFERLRKEAAQETI